MIHNRLSLYPIVVTVHRQVLLCIKVFVINFWRSSWGKEPRHLQRIHSSLTQQSYSSNNPRQMKLSMVVISDIVIELGLPVWMVERSALMNFMKKVDLKFTMATRRTFCRKVILTFYERWLKSWKSSVQRLASYQYSVWWVCVSMRYFTKNQFRRSDGLMI